MRKSSRARLGVAATALAPFLRSVRIPEEAVDPAQYPFSIPAFSRGIEVDLETTVTLFVGENGTGKSTLLEAIAYKCGFHTRGGSRNHLYQGKQEVPALAEALRLSWTPKVTEGFFLRAESFLNFAEYLDALAADDPGLYDAYGGKSLQAQSHGESFLALFLNRLNHGIFILDEPEAALSPQRQLAFLKVIHDVEQSGHAQFLIATHSPILLAYPQATILSLDGTSIRKVRYRDTEHYRITKDFLNHPDLYLRHLFAAEEETAARQPDGGRTGV